jgi:TonB family protein
MKKTLILVFVLILLAFSCSTIPSPVNNSKEGAKLFNEQKYAEAIKVFEKVLEKDPENANATYNIAISYIQLKDEDKALIYLNKTVEFNPYNDDAWYNLAIIYFNKGDYLSALGAGLDAGPDAKNIIENSLKKLNEKGVGIPSKYKAVIMGSLKRSIIGENIDKYSKDYENCYRTALLQSPDIEGKIIVGIVISGKGSVLSAQINRSTTNNEIVEKCVVEVTKKLQFPAPKGGGIVIVNYPFVFKHSIN